MHRCKERTKSNRHAERSEALVTHLSNPKTGRIPPIVILSASEELVTQPVLPKVSRKAPATPVILSVSEELVTHHVLPKVGRNEPSTLVILSVSEELVAHHAASKSEP